MSSNSPAEAPSPPPEHDKFVGAEPWTAFVAWGADELGARVAFDNGLYRLGPGDAACDARGDKAPPAPARRGWFRPGWSRALAPPAAEGDAAALETPSPHEVVAALVRRLGERPGGTDVRPTVPPPAAEDVGARLVASYRVEGGEARVAALELVDAPLVRLTWIDEGEGSPLLRHRYFDDLGNPLGWNEARLLGLDHVGPCGAGPCGERPPALDAERLDRMLTSARLAAGEPAADLAVVAWVQRARGRVRLEREGHTVEAPFDGWAQTLVAPPAVCPQTGVATFALAATDDGNLAAAEQVGSCVATGARRLVRDLVRCAASGGLALPAETDPCAATGAPVLRAKIVRCERCGLGVRPAARRGADCDACRATRPVPADDPRLRAILERHPRLAGRRWSLAETPTAYVLESSGWLGGRLVTIDRESLAALHEAERRAGSRRWRAARP